MPYPLTFTIKPHIVAEAIAQGRSIRYAGSPYQTSMAEAGQHSLLEGCTYYRYTYYDGKRRLGGATRDS